MRKVIACLAAAFLAAPSGSAAGTDVATRLLERAAEIERHGAALAEIWPGYWPPGQPFVLYLPEVGAVFGGRVGEDGPVFRTGPLPDVRSAYVIDYASGTEDTILQRLTDAEDSFAILFHEQFHDYQRAAFRGRRPVGRFVDLSGLSDQEGFVVGIDLERQLLAAALAAPTAEARRIAARQFITARHARLAAAPAHIRAAEDSFEWLEGTARYAEVRAMAVLDPNGPDPAERIRDGLAEPLVKRGVSLMQSLFRLRAYYVGAAQALLLDLLEAPDWRRQVEQGAPLANLLEARLDQTGPRIAAPPVPSPESVQAIRQTLAAHPADPEDAAAFLATHPHWLEVVVDVPVSRSKDLKVSYSASVVPLPDGDLAMARTRYILIELDDVRLEVRNRAALVSLRQVEGDRSLSRVIIAVTPDEWRALSTVARGINLETLTLELPGTVVVEAAPGRRLVRIDP